MNVNSLGFTLDTSVNYALSKDHHDRIDNEHTIIQTLLL